VRCGIEDGGRTTEEAGSSGQETRKITEYCKIRKEEEEEEESYQYIIHI
jgi:hypothetical protein